MSLTTHILTVESPVKVRREIPEQVRDDLDLSAYDIYGLKQRFHSFFLLMIQFFCTVGNFSGMILRNDPRHPSFEFRFPLRFKSIYASSLKNPSSILYMFL